MAVLSLNGLYGFREKPLEFCGLRLGQPSGKPVFEHYEQPGGFLQFFGGVYRRNQVPFADNHAMIG